MKCFPAVQRYIQEHLNEERKDFFVSLLNIQKKYSSGTQLTKDERKVILNLVEYTLLQQNEFRERVEYELFCNKHRHTEIDYNEYSNDYYDIYKKCDNKKCDCQKYKENNNGTIDL